MNPGLQVVHGWGGRPQVASRVVRPSNLVDLGEAMASGGSKIIARGLGRSYGDASQTAGGLVVDFTEMAGVELDGGTGLVTAMAGASIGDIVEAALPHGWFIPVTPGTKHVTVGGAIAADVHGKNHHRDGSFGDHVERLVLLTADGQLRETAPGDGVFEATVGGMGTTGMIVSATIRLASVSSAWISVDTRRGHDLEAVMEILAAADSSKRYSVAWVDLRDGASGRGVVMSGDHAEASDLPLRRRSRALVRSRSKSLPLPPVPSAGMVNAASVAVFNRLWFGKAPRAETGRLERIEHFFYPLDAIAGWPKLYGRAGFLQYQFVVPLDADAVLTEVAEILSRAQTAVSLTVLKRMGPSRGGLLSFPMPGWTLAVDMPLGDPDLAGVLDRCDDLVAGVGGRVYLAKDSRMRPGSMAEMYPDLAEWRLHKERLDPGGVLRSDLTDRLGLSG